MKYSAPPIPLISTYIPVTDPVAGFYLLNKNIMKKKQEVISPKDAVHVARAMLLDKNKEHFLGIYLSARNKVVKKEIISIGTISMSLVHARETFRPALVSRAVSLIVLHNHPSGCVEPSEADIAITKRLKQAGGILGIELVDHVIFDSSDKYYSFRDKNKI